jgi:acetyl-CoA C-acetyltransferase
MAMTEISPGEAVFIGLAELPSGRYPNRPFVGDLVNVAVAAVRDAGLAVPDIDTILLIPCLHSPADQADLVFSRVVEELGLHGRAKSSYMVHSGGSTSDNTIRDAAGLIGTGRARNVLVLQAEKWGSAPVKEMVDMLTANGIPREWEKPSGLSFNAVGALIQRRYMHMSGSTPADMASVCVALRDWARLNPNAMYKDRTLTVEQVLASKVVTDPLHAMECPMLADGAVGLVMTSAANARRLGSDRFVRVAGSGGCVPHYSIGQEADLAVLGWANASVEAYEEAGWGPEDADVAEVYDATRALEIGMVNRVVEPDALIATATELATRIAAKSWRAVEATKQSLRNSWQVDLAATLTANYWAHAALHPGPDVREGLDSFIEKRPGRFNQR